MKHGTTTGYQYGCRCAECRSAVMAAWRERKARGLAADDPRHGTSNGYNNWGCRCEPCTEAWRICHHAYMHADPSRLEKHALSMRLSRQAHQ